PLTSLYNRRYMLEALEQIVSRSDRKQSAMAVMMVDVDHFKRFNDTFGHKVGDIVLSNIASELKHNLRVEDTACRYGGEEFCLVCPDISAADAARIAEKLCESIRRLDLHHEQKPLGKLTISVGVAIFPDQGTNTSALIQKADELLYLAKEQGRDRVIMANSYNGTHQLISDDDVDDQDATHKSVA
ncbi:MAG: GGDEF domain-containing protein, partial [Phycisphaeraceae bacterium]|nr:GGDEF domain-containing protein [Phycisphaeraceae bacterium]